MKSFITFLLIVTISNVWAQTTVPSGNVNGIWTSAGSPYQVQGLITVQTGQTLQLDPGVIVEFVSSGKLRVKGDIQAVGSSINPITFTAQNTGTGWLGVFLDSVDVTSDSSIFEHCVLEYGKTSGLFRIINANKVRIENSIIRYGEATNGAGLYIVNAEPLIINNEIVDNDASYRGGAFYLYDSNLEISGNNISNNNADNSGAAIFIGAGDPKILNNDIDNNTAQSGAGVVCSNWCAPEIRDNSFRLNATTFDGGVIWASDADPIIVGNEFIGNTSATKGGVMHLVDASAAVIDSNLFDSNYGQSVGAIHLYDGSSAVMRGNVFNNNSAYQSSGAIKVDANCNILIENCIFSNNFLVSGNSSGGAIRITSSVTGRISNCLFVNNEAGTGGAIYMYSNVYVDFTNCTFAHNHASNRAGAVFLNAVSPTFTNTVFWGNTSATTGPNIYAWSSSGCSPSFINCNIENGQTSFDMNNNSLGAYTNNINLDPLFNSPSGGAGNGFDGTIADWQTPLSSPCYNGGTPDTTGLNLPSTDLIGSDRIQMDTVDIGPYEFQLAANVLTQSGNINSCFEDSLFLYVAANGQSTITYQWQLNGSDIAGQTNDTLIINNAILIDAGDYTCIVNNSYGIDTSSIIEVQVFTNPILTSLGPDIAFCDGEAATLQGSSSIYSHNWNNGLSIDDTLIITNSGTYYYQITDSNGCTALSDSIIALVHLLPVVSLGIDTTICIFDSALTIIGTPSGGTLSGSGLIGNSFYPNSAGTGVYLLSYEYSDVNLCTNTDSIIITVDSCVAMMATVDSQSAGISVCQQDSLILYVSASGAQPISYQWLFNNIPISGETNDTLSLIGVNVLDAGSYNCLISNFINADTSTTIPVIVNTNPILNSLGPDITVCDGESWTLFTSTGTYSYDWNNGLASTDSLVVTLPTFYYYSVIDANGCISQSDTIELMVNSLPVVNAGNDTSLCTSAPLLTLSGNPSGGTFSGVAVIDSLFDPALSGNGTFVITYQYSDSTGCMNYDSLTILVESCLGMQLLEQPAMSFICYPNPANNILNLSFNFPEEKIKSISIHDLFGKIIFYSENYLTPILLSDYNDGSYILRINLETKTIMEKFVISN
jgi:hypothetical protein